MSLSKSRNRPWRYGATLRFGRVLRRVCYLGLAVMGNHDVSPVTRL